MTQLNVDEASQWVRDTMTEASDAVMKRVKLPHKKKQVHWWNNEIKKARTLCIKSRRKLTRERRKKIKDVEEIRELEKSYRLQKKRLSIEIYKAKEETWKVLISTINNDPWGIPYRLVMGKLRSRAPSLTETLTQLEVDMLLKELFPRNREGKIKYPELPMKTWKEEWNITEAEVYKAIKGRICTTTAPGPNGLTNKIWKMVPDCLIHILAQIFTTCMKKGEFPNMWKRAVLVLIPKGTEYTGLLKARPICLIDEISKTFERILTERINAWMEKRIEDRFYTLSNNQFGFRKNKSTVDVLIKVRKYIEEETCRGSVVIAISLDIKNAFNSIPWACIRGALYWKRFPRYLKRILHSYLSNRYIDYVNKDGNVKQLTVEAGVPQGSVIGPLLWNIAYDSVLYVDREPGSEVYCYADDTLILITGETFEEARERASMMAERILDKRIKATSCN